MIIKALHIDGFGKLINRSLSFSEGLNIIYGENEAGKSTLHSFLNAMLYGSEKRPGSPQRSGIHRYRPWDENAPFGGSIRFSFLGRTYTMHRSFSSFPDIPEIFEELHRDGEAVPQLIPVEEPTKLLERALEGLSESSYRNTISIGQLKSGTGREMVQELRRYLSSMESSGSSELSTRSVLARLSGESRACHEALVPEASKSYSMLIGEIKNIERELNDSRFRNLLPQLKALYRESLEASEGLKKDREELSKRLSSEKETLSASGFKSGDELSEDSQKCDELFQRYTELKETLEKRSGITRLIGRLLSGLHNDTAEMDARAIKESLESRLQQQLGENELSGDSIKRLRLRFSNLKRSFSELEEREEELRAMDEELSRLENEGRSLGQSLSEQLELRTEVESKLQHLNNMKNRVEQLEKILSENERLKQKIDALELAMESITEISERVRLSFGRYLNEEAGRLISEITGGAYSSVWIDDRFNAQLNTENGEIPLESVSSGTIDQIYLALRLASARLFLRNASEPLPLTLDDSFAFYDEKRLSSALSFISKHYEGQILLFTCHKREQQLLKKSKQSFKLLEL